MLNYIVVFKSDETLNCKKNYKLQKNIIFRKIDTFMALTENDVGHVALVFSINQILGAQLGLLLLYLVENISPFFSNKSIIFISKY
jgi:hypothetical protein